MKTSRLASLVALLLVANAGRVFAQAPVFATIDRPPAPRTRGLSTPASTRALPQPGLASKPGLPPNELQFPRTRGVDRDSILVLFGRGVNVDMAGKYQLTRLRGYLATLTDGQVLNLSGLLGQSSSETERVFLLKSLLAGEPWENLLAYAAEMRGFSEEQIISRSTMRDNPDLVQQWQDSCGPSMLQTVAGEADPRYAWELNKLGTLSDIDPFGANSALAQQQKQWLEKHGGLAVPRGQTGRGISITDFLNESLGPIVDARYVCQTVTSLDFALNRITELLQEGYDIPVCLGWDETGTNNHFVVLLAARGMAGSRSFQVHDTWSGATAWVPESSIRQNKLSPIFENFTKLSHYYEPFAN